MREKNDYNYSMKQSQAKNSLLFLSPSSSSSQHRSEEKTLMEINLNEENFVFAGNIFKCERFCEAIIIKCRHVGTIVVRKEELGKVNLEFD